MAKAHIEQAAIGSEAKDQSEGTRTRGYGQIANESIEASTMIVNENARPPIWCGEYVQRRRDTPECLAHPKMNRHCMLDKRIYYRFNWPNE